MIHELPYFEDSSGLFAPWAQQPWSVFLDSGYPASRKGRYDIIAAQPSQTLMTRGGLTELRSGDEVTLSPADPFELLKKALLPLAPAVRHLPFYGGAIGYFGYDLARRLEKIPSVAEDAENIPEMIIGVFDWSVVVDHVEKRSWLVGMGRDPVTKEKWPELIARFSKIQAAESLPDKFHICGKIASNMTAERYAFSFNGIKHYLREGDCYQVNLAQRFSAKCEGSPWLAYRDLRRANAAPFSAFLNFPQVQILSSSPERFLMVRDGSVETKPIKGTRPRDANPDQDRAQIRALSESVKDRAENLMIVDLLRNDISKECKKGSVRVPKLFDIESFATVHHMVSTVCGALKNDRHALDLLRSCFPGGSITGAPKIRAMEIIEELEPNRRGAYCGSVGYIGFDGNMDSNIAIRTLVHSDHTIRFWAGGGIVADSVLDAEYQESFDKASAILRFLDLTRVEKGVNHVGG
ncbi:MAG: aminodeoxychorismate synthase component I [Pseudomonadota bacterium]